jgi:hypothetical protein
MFVVCLKSSARSFRYFSIGAISVSVVPGGASNSMKAHERESEGDTGAPVM